MANEYFQKPQLNQAQLIRTQEAQAVDNRNQQQYNSSLISSQLDSLNQIGKVVAHEVDEYKSAKNKNMALRKTVNMPSYINDNVRVLAEKDGKSFKDISDAELDTYTQQATKSFYEENEINGTDYAEHAYEIGQGMSLQVQNRMTDLRNKENINFNRGIIEERVEYQSAQLAKGQIHPDDMVKVLSEQLKVDSRALGSPSKSNNKYPDEVMNKSLVLDTHLAKESQFKGLIAYGINNGEPKVVESLETKEMRAYFKDMPNYNKTIASLKQKNLKTIAARSQVHFENVEEKAYAIMGTGMMTSEADVNSFIDGNLSRVPKQEKPSSKDIYRLKAKLMKEIPAKAIMPEYVKSYTTKKDNTYLSQQHPKVAKQLVTDDFKNSVGINDFSQESIASIAFDEKKSLSFKAYANSGRPFPDALVTALNNTPIGNINAMEKQSNIYNSLVHVTNGTARNINSIMEKKAVGNMLYINNLLEDKEMSKAEKQEAYISYTNDINSSVDSFGIYYSVRAKEYFNNPDIDTKLNEFSKDAPWTYDDNTSSAYIKRDMKDSIARLIAAGVSEDDVWDRAEENFSSTHRLVEAPDGSEVVQPKEFMDVSQEDMLTMLNASALVRKHKELATFQGDFMWNRRLSWRPVSNYGKSKEMEMYIDGKRLENTRFTRKDLDTVVHSQHKFDREKILEKLNKAKSK